MGQCTLYFSLLIYYLSSWFCSSDNTKTGHCLGHYTVRGQTPSPERSLSPAACCILRAIMHAVLLWTSCNNLSTTRDLIGLIKPEVKKKQELPMFFWGHLERDIQLLAKALDKNFEEAIIVVHLVLKNMVISKLDCGEAND